MQYVRHLVSNRNRPIDAQLNEVGEEGWELVGVEQMAAKEFVAFLKRKKQKSKISDR